MNSVCIECKECDYYLPVENNIRPVEKGKPVALEIIQKNLKLLWSITK